MIKLFETWFNQLMIFAPIASGLFGAIFFLIKIYTGDQKKIKELEVESVLSNVKSLDSNLVEHKKSISVLTVALRTTREELIAVKTRLEMTVKNEENFIKSIETMKRSTDEKISEIENTLGDSEIIKLGGNRFMLKGRSKK